VAAFPRVACISILVYLLIADPAIYSSLYFTGTRAILKASFFRLPCGATVGRHRHVLFVASSSSNVVLSARPDSSQQQLAPLLNGFPLKNGHKIAVLESTPWRENETASPICFLTATASILVRIRMHAAWSTATIKLNFAPPNPVASRLISTIFLVVTND
jgi:hypothetical protein